MTPTRTRIAPTPSGYLHRGNLYSFVLTWLYCRKAGGKLLLRIDDMDGPRMRDEYLEDIFESLAFIGLQYDEGPADSKDFKEHFSQQHRLSLYGDLLIQLKQTGLVYGCTCSRKDLAQAPCRCREKKWSLEDPETAWRIRVDDAEVVTFKDEMLGNVEVSLADAMGDFVIRRKDGLPAYQTCSLADDLHYHINMVVRGEDLLVSTAAQLWLAGLLGLTAFPICRFLHHPLVKDANEQKLSKSAGASSIKTFRENGGQPAELIRYIAGLPGIDIHQPVNTLEELLHHFAQPGG